MPAPARERLHKFLARSGVASRRKCEDLIRDGRVRVNGSIVREMGVQVVPDKDVVQVDDARVRPERSIYLLLYKPKDYLCTTSDQFGRKTILDLVPEHRRTRLFTVGRLDLESEGLIVLTNDGAFAQDTLHPRRRLPRTYYVKVQGHVTPEQIAQAQQGVWLSDGRTPPMDVRLQRAGRDVSTLKCTLVERHHHQLRRIWAKLELPVLRLVLVRIADIGTEDLKKGAVRPLTAGEVESLRHGAPGHIVRPPRRPAAAPKTEKRASGWGAAASSDRPERADRPGRSGPPASRRGAGRREKTQRPKPSASSSSRVSFRKRGR
jgi:23S rRNA pseudouridine2605 synthase